MRLFNKVHSFLSRKGEFVVKQVKQLIRLCIWAVLGGTPPCGTLTLQTYCSKQPIDFAYEKRVEVYLLAYLEQMTFLSL